jgi:hypothetical protein
MLALIGTILGLLGSLAPEILKYFNNKEDHRHEAEMLTLTHTYHLEEVNVEADISSEQAAYKNATQILTGWKIIDGIVSLYNMSVRPTITYIFMATYILVKYAIYTSYTQIGYTWQQAVSVLWTSEDFAVFSTIMAFWFGGRFMKWTLERLAPPKKEVARTANGKNGVVAPKPKDPDTTMGGTHGDK